MAKAKNPGRLWMCTRRRSSRRCSTLRRGSCRRSAMNGDDGGGGRRSARGCRGRCGRRMRPARPGTGWRASSRSGAWSVWSRRRARSRGRRGDRVKTDRRDAELLVRLLLAGKLHAVRVPGDEEEALRDLVRARDAVRMDLMRCRHRLSKLLLRHGIRFDDGQAWTERHRDWLATVTLEWPAAQATLLDAQGAIDALAHRREQLEREIVALLPGSPWAVQVGRLRCLRGVDTLTAVGLCAEIGDFERFARAEQLMSYVGLVPSRVNDRAAAPARVDHEDRLRARPPAAGRGRLALPPAPADRQGADRPPETASPPEAIAIAWSAQQRLHRTWTTPRGARQAPHDHRGRRRPRARRVLPGRSPKSSDHDPDIAYPVGWVGGGPATRGEPATNYEQPAPQGRPRPILDSGSPRRTMVLRHPKPAYISLTARRAQPAGPPPTQPTTTPRTTKRKCEKSYVPT